MKRAPWDPFDSAATPGSTSEEQILAPFLARYLKDDASSATTVAPVMAFAPE